MSDAVRAQPGVYGPGELRDIVAAYRAILQEISEHGALAALARSGTSALEIRRLAAKHVMAESLLGVESGDELIARVLARFAAPTPVPGQFGSVDAEAASA